MRIATASVRTGFAMTGFFTRSRCKAGRADRGVRPYGWVASRAAEWATARVAPTGCNMGCGGAGRCGHRPLRRGYKDFGKRAAGDMQERASLRPPFGFLGKKIPASKAGSILPYYGGGDNARKNFVVGEILSHTMIFF